jgi:hypothetical protein
MGFAVALGTSTKRQSPKDPDWAPLGPYLARTSATMAVRTSWRSLIIACGDEFCVDAYMRYLVGRPNTGKFYFFFFCYLFYNF